MSETAISRLTISRPFAVRRLRLRLFLLTLVSLKLPEVFRLTSRCCGVVVLGSRPRSFSGHSILMISAPNAPSQRVAHGPARTQLKSTTRIPARAFMGEMLSFAGLSDTLDLLTPVSRINSITENVRLAFRKMGDRAGLEMAVSVCNGGAVSLVDALLPAAAETIPPRPSYAAPP